MRDISRLRLEIFIRSDTYASCKLAETDLESHSTEMFGPDIVVRTSSTPNVLSGVFKKKFGIEYYWQYNSRSDHHSKVCCWSVLFDLYRNCPLMQAHAASGKIGASVNHEMTDFHKNKAKNLDLVVSRFVAPAGALGRSRGGAKTATDFVCLGARHAIPLTAAEKIELAKLPKLPISGVSNVLIAVEAKAAMTAHQRAVPRLHDELTSSHTTVHGDTNSAIAAALVMINAAVEYISPESNEGTDPSKGPMNVSRHKQPKDAQLVLDSLRELRSRSNTDEDGFDAIGALVVDCRNDGITPTTLVSAVPPAPGPAHIHDYGRFINRMAQLYSTRFANL